MQLQRKGSADAVSALLSGSCEPAAFVWPAQQHWVPPLYSRSCYILNFM